MQPLKHFIKKDIHSKSELNIVSLDEGRYSLREINGIWYIYDRDSTSIVTSTNEHTRTKARNALLNYKGQHGDL